MGLEQLGFEKVPPEDVAGTAGAPEGGDNPQDSDGDSASVTPDAGQDGGDVGADGSDVSAGAAGGDGDGAGGDGADGAGDGAEPVVTDGAVVSFLNEKGIGVQSVDDIVSAFSKVKDLEEKVQTLSEKVDPLKYFSSKEAYIAEQVKMKHPELNPFVVQKVVLEDVGSLNDIDAVVYSEMLRVPGVSESDARAVVNKRYFGSVDGGQEDADPVNVAQLRMDAVKARSELQSIGKDIEVPDSINPDELAKKRAEAQEEILGAWSGTLQNITSDNKLVIDDGRDIKIDFQFEVPAEYSDALREMVVSGGLDVNSDNAGMLRRFLEMNVLHDNFQKILSVYRNQVESAMQKKFDEENATENPPNGNVRPAGGEQGDDGLKSFLSRSRVPAGTITL